MAIIIRFPAADAQRGRERERAASPAGVTRGKIKCMSHAFGRGLWMIFAALWPLVRFAFTIDLLWQFGRMVWLWDRPGAYAGWTFMLHFLAFSFCFYILATYRPKGFEE